MAAVETKNGECANYDDDKVRRQSLLQLAFKMDAEALIGHLVGVLIAFVFDCLLILCLFLMEEGDSHSERHLGSSYGREFLAGAPGVFLSYLLVLAVVTSFQKRREKGRDSYDNDRHPPESSRYLERVSVGFFSHAGAKVIRQAIFLKNSAKGDASNMSLLWSFSRKYLLVVSTSFVFFLSVVAFISSFQKHCQKIKTYQDSDSEKTTTRAPGTPSIGATVNKLSMFSK